MIPKFAKKKSNPLINNTLHLNQYSSGLNIFRFSVNNLKTNFKWKAKLQVSFSGYLPALFDDIVEMEGSVQHNVLDMAVCHDSAIPVQHQAPAAVEGREALQQRHDAEERVARDKMRRLSRLFFSRGFGNGRSI